MCIKRLKSLNPDIAPVQGCIVMGEKNLQPDQAFTRDLQPDQDLNQGVRDPISLRYRLSSQADDSFSPLNSEVLICRP
jgi:hypothetical protein